MNNRKRIRILQISIVLGVVAVSAAIFYGWKHRPSLVPKSISYTRFIDQVNAGEILKVAIEGNEISADGRKGEKFRLFRPVDAELSKLLLAKHIDFSAQPQGTEAPWIQGGFMLVVLGVLFLIMKKLAVFGPAKAKLSDRSRTNTSFTDVAGAEEAKHDLGETVDFLKEPQKFTHLGGRMPRGILLVGPPGTGKTLLARAVAGEAGVPFFSLSGSEFVEMYVGVGASRVRDLFVQGRKAAPCIIFIDELDAVGRRRDGGTSGASDERNQTLNQLLVEMDGFSVNAGVVVIAATNRPEVLDPALLRPGRFDRQVVVGSPDIRGREAILRVHTRNVPLSAEVDLRIIARGTPGFSGAELANVVNEAAILAARANKLVVEMADFDVAKDKVLMGAEKKSMVLSEKAKTTTAFHESGHVMVAKLVPGCDPVHKVSIVPRGRALGVTVQIPEEDIHCYTKEMLMGHLKVLMGGRAAEELVFQTTTTGAGSDIARATEMARRMVCEWGMSEAFGPVAFGAQEAAAQGEGTSSAKGIGDATAVEIDAEIRLIVTTAYDEVRDLLRTHRHALDTLARELLAEETLSAGRIDEILTTVLTQVSA